MSIPSSKKRKRSTPVSIHNRSNRKNIKSTNSLLRKRKFKLRKRGKQIFLELTITTVISLFLFSFCQLFVFTFSKVSGYSMTTTLTEGDRLFISKLAPIKRYDLIYFIHPFTKEKIIQRVIGLQGEALYYQNDQLIIDGEQKIERFLIASIIQAKKEHHLFTNDFTLLDKTGKSTIPKDSYFVMVDNRMYETDSRKFGFVRSRDVIGVVKLKFSPLHQMQKF